VVGLRAKLSGGVLVSLARVWRTAPGQRATRLAKRLGLDLDQRPSVLLADLDRRLTARPGRRVAVFTDQTSRALPGALARWRPSIRAVHEYADDERTHSNMTADGLFDVIIDATASTPAEKIDRLKRTRLHLRTGGRYLARTSDLGGLLRPGGEAHQDLAGSFTKVSRRHGLVQLTTGVTAMPRLRYEEVDRLVEARRLPRATVVTTLPAVTWDSRSRVSTNRDYLRRRFPPRFEVPSLSLRAYDGVLCWPHQVLTMGGVLLPDSYRHFHSPRFNNHWLKVVEVNFAQYRRKRKKAVRLPGRYFYLGSEYPQHFGHVMTEQVSRLWAWRAAKERYPDLKALVSVSRVKDGLLPFEKAIFQAAGIAAEDLIGIKGFARVDHLLAAAPMFVNPAFIHPEIVDVWRRIGTTLRRDAPEREYPEKIFASRRPTRLKRRCHNTEELENLFRHRGFTIVYPEDYSIAEQAMIFDQAAVIAGFAGSGLFTMMFSAEPKPVIMISSTSYTARNEYLIASAIGHDLTVIYSIPDIHHPRGGWTNEAFQSPFTFDFDNEGRYLNQVLSELSLNR
jgi:capsular polysaccharide biosynthesis protein